MDTDTDSPTKLKKGPLGRFEVEQLLRQAGSSYELDLSSLDLRGIDLCHFNLSGCNLSGADLRDAQLHKTNLEKTNLSKANLSHAKLDKTNLRDADLSNANLSHTFLLCADLTGANLTGTDLLGANLTLAKLDQATMSNNYIGANFNDVDLNEADKERLKNAVQIRNIATANPANIQEVAASQIAINNNYYESVLKQTNNSFRSALVLSIIGTVLITVAVILAVIAVILLAIRQPANLSYTSLIGGFVSLIGGTVINAVAGLNFSLYGRTLNQLTTFQAPLDRVSRFLIANSVCERIEGDLKNSTRAKLVEVIANTPVKNVIEKEPETKFNSGILNRRNTKASSIKQK